MISRFLILIGVLLLMAVSVFADSAYPDPPLKVLLIETSGSVSLSSRDGLNVNGVLLTNRKSNWIRVKLRDTAAVQLDDDLMVNGSAFFRSQEPIAIKTGTASTRRYLGVIEIQPFEKGIRVINHVKTETYLEGVLNAEISTNWPIEVVKAQAVISRTFALYQRARRRSETWHVKSNFHDQVYKGVDISDARGRFAIQSTTGLVVCHQGRLAQTFYHSNSGGATEDPGNLWQMSLPYLSVKSVPFGKSDPRYYWNVKMSQKEIQTLLKKAGIGSGKIEEIEITGWNSSNRVEKIRFIGEDSVTLSGNNFRKLAGYRRVQSLIFEIEKTADGFLLEGRGNGHGVGLSQWSAKEMAEEGYGFESILSFFYDNIELKSYRE